MMMWLCSAYCNSNKHQTSSQLYSTLTQTTDIAVALFSVL